MMEETYYQQYYQQPIQTCDICDWKGIQLYQHKAKIHNIHRDITEQLRRKRTENGIKSILGHMEMISHNMELKDMEYLIIGMKKIIDKRHKEISDDLNERKKSNITHHEKMMKLLEEI
ncbi:MAG: hypothetical protein ACYDAP_00365 [Thermoplasmataceae archaeon]